MKGTRISFSRLGSHVKRTFAVVTNVNIVELLFDMVSVQKAKISDVMALDK